MNLESSSAFSNPVSIFCANSAIAWILPVSRYEIVKGLACMLSVLASHGFVLRAVELQLVTDAEIARANSEFLYCFGPTNILSFPDADSSCGCLILSLETLERECLLYGQQKLGHLWLLLAHGMAHLAGLDHGEEMEKICSLCQNAVLEYFAQS